MNLLIKIQTQGRRVKILEKIIHKLCFFVEVKIKNRFRNIKFIYLLIQLIYLLKY